VKGKIFFAEGLEHSSRPSASNLKHSRVNHNINRQVDLADFPSSLLQWPS
jgi:hypothetical protein